MADELLNVPGMDLPAAGGELQDVAGIGRSARQMMLERQPRYQPAGTSGEPRLGGVQPPMAAREDYPTAPREETPNFFDQLRIEGVPESVIGQYVADNRAEWRTLGFTDDIIDKTVTGSGNARKFPVAFLDRAAAAQESYNDAMQQALGAGVDVQFPTMSPLVGRLSTAGAETFNYGFGEEPLGVPEEEMAKLRAIRNNGLITHAVDEAIVQVAYSTINGLFRTINGVLTGLGGIAGQGLEELAGGNDSEQARARRDMAQMANIAAILAGSEVGRGNHGITEKIGRAPQSQDFTNAAKILHPDVTVDVKPFDPKIRKTLMRTWDDYGIHPAEVVNDAQIDPTVATSIARGEIPERYTGKPAPPPPRPGAPPRRPPPGEDPYVGVYIKPDGRTIGVMQTMDGKYVLSDLGKETRGLDKKDIDNYLAKEQAVRYERQRPPPAKPLLIEKKREAGRPPPPEHYEVTDYLGSPEPGGKVRVRVTYNTDGTVRTLETNRGITRPAPPLKDLPAEEVIAHTFGDHLNGEEPDLSKIKHVDTEEYGKPQQLHRGVKADEPPVPPDHVRFYHGAIEGTDPTTGGTRWVTPDREYARNFRAMGTPKEVHYVDLPIGSEAEKSLRAWDDFDVGTNMEGRYRHGEIPEEVAKQLKPLFPRTDEGIHPDVAAYDKVSPEGIPAVEYEPGRNLTRSPDGTYDPREVLGPGDGSDSGPGRGGLGVDNPVGPPRPPEPPPEQGWRTPGPARRPRPPIFTYDDRNAFVKFGSNLLDAWKHTFQPELVSDLSLRADPLFARYKSRQASAHDAAIKMAEEYRHFWFGVSEEDRWRYMNDFEAGRFKMELEEPGKPDVWQRVVGRGEEAWQQIAQRHSDMLEAAFKAEEEAGSKASYVQDYLPHIFEDPVRARNWIAGRVRQMGANWFQKHRAFDMLWEAREAGLRLVTTNPEDLVSLRMMASADMIERMDLLRRLHDMRTADDDIYGMAVKKKGLNYPLEQEGWQPIVASNGEEWLLHPDVVPLYENAVRQKGLWAMEGGPISDVIGGSFRNWMAFKNAWMPIKLGASLFHPLHVYHINMTEGMVRAADQIWKPIRAGESPDVVGAIKSAMEGVYGPLQAAIPGAPHLGKTAREAWKKPENERNADQRVIVDLMNDGGFSPELSEQLRVDATRKLQNAVQNGQWVRMGFHGLRFIIQELSNPIFQHWIPNIKTAAYLQDAQALLQRRPELFDNHEQRRVALRAISKSIDNRFGEMFYGSLFVNRYVKDAGIGSFISLGWQLGGIREFGGAAVQLPARMIRGAYRKAQGMPWETETEGTIREAQNKIEYTAAYWLLWSLIAGTAGYMFVSSYNKRHPELPPEDPMPQNVLDLNLPRLGGRNPDGSPRRLNTFSYTREIPMWQKHYEEEGGGVWGAILGSRDMLANKTVFGPVIDLLRNKNYYGSQIFDPAGQAIDQAKQILSYLGKETTPISWTAYDRARNVADAPWEPYLAFTGMGPAPAYVSKTSIQHRIDYYFDNFVAPKMRTYMQGAQTEERGLIRQEMMDAKRRGDKEGERAAVEKWAAAGGSLQGITNMEHNVGGDVAKFRALPYELQMQVLKDAGPEDMARYGKWAKSNIVRDSAVLSMQALQAQKDGNMTEYRRLIEQRDAATQKAAKEGHITNRGAFKRSVNNWMKTYNQPEVGSLLTIPKKLRRDYVTPAPVGQPPQ